MLTKLLFRTLPQHYTPKSIYAHFPFIVPSRMREKMKKEPGMVERYDWTEPHSVSAIIPVKDYWFVKEIVTNTTTFCARYETLAASLTAGHAFYSCIGGDSTKHKRTLAMVRVHRRIRGCIANVMIFPC